MRFILPVLTALPLAAHSEQLRVVTDIAPIHSLVAQVMDGVGTPDVLVSGAASPHDFQFTFAQAQSVQDADLVIWMGDGLTPWLHESLETLADGTSQIALLDVDGWPKLELRSEPDFESYREAHDHGHDGDHEAHSGDHNTDPHAWLDPVVAHAWLGVIANALIEADPENAAQYQENLAAAQSTWTPCPQKSPPPCRMSRPRPSSCPMTPINILARGLVTPPALQSR
jgi:zinc transport system substrate-binding protein